ncbi:MAG: hypothetical protein JST17_06540 [Bacteroidetes bacterium]|nr:hypothetical protein [Bacteroidota bacterium]MBS1929782.1 hypothetical protein [Bacteroidota bacterium]
MKSFLFGLTCILVSMSLFGQTKGSNTNSITNTTSINESMTSWAALPVYETYIPADVVTNIKLRTTKGNEVYDITDVKSSTGNDEYVVRTIRNGSVTTEKLDINGNAF